MPLLLIFLNLGISLPAKVAPNPEADAVRFKAVSEQIDPGGVLYAYISVDGDLAALGEWVEKIIGQIREDNPQQIPFPVDVAQLLQISGMDKVAAVGFSSKATASGFRNKSFFYTPEARVGFLRVFGGKPKPAGTGTGTGGEGALRDRHERKTGALINAAAVSGAILAGGSPATVGAIDAYATHLGLAFQIVDDILDVIGTTDELGKTAGKDATACKPTYPSIYGIDHSRLLAAEAVAASRAELATAGLGGRLPEIADWVVSRTR